MSQGSVKDVENYLTPSEAGRFLGTSGQWVKQLARRGDLQGVETRLGWLIEPGSLERLADERVRRAEGKVSSLKSVRSKTKTGTIVGPTRGRADHGKTLRARSKRV